MNLKTWDAEPEELPHSDETDIMFLSREANQFDDLASLITLAGREAEADAEPISEPGKKKNKNKSKKRVQKE